ncbi:recombinase family protein [Ferruginibacter albus]|uniref:recombinase family protein n=1 Tax=Ferruginibacter albus TaxID=2875540 RepID=UPI001CC3AB52|nr:recombinase family protein [Ferruginibacter albus]UAY53177.1 recombinase family protein [Ferruginibacter albus]
MIKNAVAYYRVSTKKQGISGLGLKAQEYSVRTFAKGNKFKIAKEFIEVESGKKRSRPILIEAIKYCREKKATLIIAKLNRLGRNVAYVSALMEDKFNIIAVEYPYASKFLLHVIAAFDQNEREQISKNTKAALAVAKKRGVRLGEFGKVLAKRNINRSKIFLERMKPILLRLKRLGFKSAQSIADELNKRKVKTYRKNGSWQTGSVYILLRKIS